MEHDISFLEGGLYGVIRITSDGDVLLLHCAPYPFDEKLIPLHTLHRYRLVELQVLGEDQDDHHGNKHTGCMPGYRLRYLRHEWSHTDCSAILCIVLEGNGLRVFCELEFFNGLFTVRSRTRVQCLGPDEVYLTYVSSFALTGLSKGVTDPSRTCSVSWALNSWCSELQWRNASLETLGMAPISSSQSLHNPEQYQNFSLQSITPCGRGTWSCSEFLPMGAFEDTEHQHTIVWQIEAGGPWQWEISTIAGEYYLLTSGPDDDRQHWRKLLTPGEEYTTPSTAVSFAATREQAFQYMTRYRRLLLRPCCDLAELPVIFNDYMALLGDPTESKLIPLIDAAAEAGGEYFCIDSGWYADGNWWDSVGLWQPEPRRFPHGIESVMRYIRSRGMIPGLWLEPEVMGVRCPLAQEWPDECFFLRGGRRVIDHGRYQLDFRHPLVRKHLDETVDRLVSQYGAGYLKLDYNINAGYGTEFQAPSAGVGLEEHLRAYRQWLSGIQTRWPELIIENCASGGMRMEYGLLSMLSIQSLSDQDEAVKLAAIAAAAPTAVTPEQSACWSLPHSGQSDEEMIFSMVNVMLLRIHQSGDLNHLSDSQIDFLREALSLYKTYRQRLPQALPFWPAGLPKPGSSSLCLGMDFGDFALVAVWNLNGTDALRFSLPRVFRNVRQFYPSTAKTLCSLDDSGQVLRVQLPPAPSARLYRLESLA